VIEKMDFKFSGVIKDETDIEAIEFWGHDAGEFVTVEKPVLIEKVEEVSEEKKSTEDTK
jgi:hypothetical protein